MFFSFPVCFTRINSNIIINNILYDKLEVCTTYGGGVKVINLDNICQNAVNEIDDFQGIYIKEKLVERCKNIVRESMDMNGVRDSVMQAALELTTEQEPKWQYIASKLYMNRLYDEVKLNRGN